MSRSEAAESPTPDGVNRSLTDQVPVYLIQAISFTGARCSIQPGVLDLASPESS
jgi:hypothetical protein